MSDAPRVKAQGVWQLSMLLPITGRAPQNRCMDSGDTDDLRSKLLEQLEKTGLRENQTIRDN